MLRRTRTILALFGLLLVSSWHRVRAEPVLPSNFTDDLVVAGLDLPLDVTFLPNGHVLVAEKRGVVRLVKNGVLQLAPFIDLSAQVNDSWDRGLLGIAVDPAFTTNGFVYLYYTFEHDASQYTGPKTNRLTRVTASGDAASLATEHVLVGSLSGPSCNGYPVGADCIPADSSTHDGGAVEFAADGTLYLSTGDAADFTVVDDLALRAQAIDSLAGKILRLSANGDGLADNPFWNGDPRAARSRVWAYGLRNPFRFTLSPTTATPFVGDVGWNDYEEVNAVPRGANLGWPCYEGAARQPGYESRPVCQTLYAAGPAAVTPPLTAYAHGGHGASITGGVFYSATTFPAQYHGAYFFGDYDRGFIRSLSVDASDRLVSGPNDFATGLAGPVDIELGPDGHLYYVAIFSGEVRRIRYAAPGSAQGIASSNISDSSATITWTTSQPTRGQVQYGTTAEYALATPLATSLATTHQATLTGLTGNTLYHYRIRSEDATGTALTSSGLTFTTRGNAPPTATIAAPSGSLRYAVGDVVNYAGSATDVEDGALSGANLGWNIILHHCENGGCHGHAFASGSGAVGSFVVPDHGDDNYFEIVLSATDHGGAMSTVTRTVHPQTVQLTLNTSPVGLDVIYGGTSTVAPLVRTTVVGSRHSIAVATPQGRYGFQAWSDGGAQQHEIVVGATAVVVTAVFADTASTYWFVAPDGQPHNTGSEASPLDLATALSSSSPVRPGDTIWLRQGIYPGIFVSHLQGTEDAPITVRQYPGERATIDSAPHVSAALTIFGAWTTYWGFEIMSSEPNRQTDIPGTASDIYRGAGVAAFGEHISLVNLVVHDMGTAGLGLDADADTTLAYGNILYANGWLGPDRGHGHGIYAQNRLGIQRIIDNLIFNQFSHGVHAYGSEASFLDNIWLEGNIIFNNGIFQPNDYERNILIGGLAVAANPVAIRNYTYFNPDRPAGKPNSFGYAAGCANLIARENYWAHLTMNTFALVNCDGDIRDNFMLGFIYPDYLARFPDNDFHPVLNNDYQAARPTGSRVFVRPNLYEPGRAHIAIFNWDNLPSVTVDLSATGLTPGTPFEIRDAQNYFGSAVVVSTYTGAPVTIPLDSTDVSTPSGNVLPPSHTSAEFGAFVVLPLTTGLPPPPPSAVFTATPTTIDPGGAAVLLWATSNAAQVSIDQGVGSVGLGGAIQVSPAQTTTYQLTALSAAGATAQRRVTVRVRQPVTISWPPPAASVYGTSLGPAQLNATPNVPGTLTYLPAAGAVLPAGTGHVLSVSFQPTDRESYATATATVTIDVLRATPTITWPAPLPIPYGTTLNGLQLNAAAAVPAVFTYAPASGSVLLAGQHTLRATVVPADAANYNTTAAEVSLTVVPATPVITWPSPSPLPVGAALGAAQLNAAADVAGSFSYSPPAGTVLPVGTHNVSAELTPADLANYRTASAIRTVTITSAVTFAGVDVATQGNWRGRYGTEGYHLVNDATSLPPSMQVTSTDFFPYTWLDGTSDVRALQRAATTGRRAATGYHPQSFKINVRLADGQAHDVAVYLLDWDRAGRQQRIEVSDVLSGTLLDTRSIADFGAGTYLSWRVTGHVSFSVTRFGPSNAILSAVFVDPAGGAPPPAVVATPTISPAGGAFASQVTVTLASATAGAAVHYTTDGSTPTPSAPLYTAPIGVAATTTLNARAFATGLTDSAVASATFTITPPAVVATPAISPAGGAFASQVTVTLASATAGAAVHYTTDGSTPTPSAPLYTAPIGVAATTTLNARAFAAGLTDSAVATATFTITSPPPPGGGAGAAMFVGTDVTTLGAWRGAYGSGGYALATDAASLPSTVQVTSTDFYPYTWIDGTADLRALQRPTGSGRRAATWYHAQAATVTVRITDGLPRRIALYLVDWDRSGRQQRLDVRHGTTGAVLNTRTVSDFGGGQYLVWDIAGHITITLTRMAGANAILSAIFIDPAGGAPPPAVVATPTISPAGGAFASQVTVTLASATPGAAVHYTTDGSTPTPSAPLYTAPIGVAATTTLNARAFATGLTDSAVASATFTITPPAVVATPAISPAGGAFASQVTVTLASATAGAAVHYTTDGSTPTPSAPLYTAPIGVAATTTLNARAFAAGLTDSAVATATFTITSPPPPGGGAGAAMFVGTDVTTLGAWRGAYGSGGYALATDAASLPSTVQVTSTDFYPYTWIDGTADLRALQRPTGSGRRAATWYHAQAATVTVRITDGLPRRIALYLVDWDRSGRQQRLDVRHGTTGAVLNTRTVSDFGGGQYLVWDIAGHITITLTRTAGANAILSAIFIDPAGGAPPPAVVATPTISPAGGAFASQVTVTLASATPGAAVHYTTDGSTPTPSAPLYTAPIGVAATTTLNARAFAAGLTDSAVASATFTITPAGAGAAAAFVQTDRATLGNWRGAYGAAGYTLPNDATNLPPTVPLSSTDMFPYTWTDATGDLRAAQRASGTARIAATWYHPTAFTMTLRLASGGPRRIALYFLDWDRAGRQQRIDIRQVGTGTLLDSRTVSDFGGGQHLTWDVSGDVTITVTRLAGPNAVVSGLFVD